MQTTTTGRHSLDLEQAVLGACLLDKNAFPEIGLTLRPGSFYDQRNVEVFNCFLRLFTKGSPIDILTVAADMRKAAALDAIGGPSYLVELTNRVASSANMEAHSRIIKQFEVLREGGRIGAELKAASLDPTTDPFLLLERMQQELFGLVESISTKQDVSTMQLVLQELKKADKLRLAKAGLVGIPTKLTQVDAITSGLQAPDLIVIAARPGMGKTAFLLTLVRNMAIAKIPVGVFSLEMSSAQLIQRLASMESGVPLRKIKNPSLMDDGDYDQYMQAMSRIADWPIYLDDTAGISVFEARAKARRMKVKHGVECIFLDYLQLATDPLNAKNREQEISAISRGLKGVAKELDVPVVALSQLSRAVEFRGGAKRPQLSDLRESGGIEQDADIVGFLYRPEYYGITEDESGNSVRGLAELIIAKHRNGPLDTVFLKFEATHTLFSDAPGMHEVDFSQAPPPPPYEPRPVADDENIPF